MASEQLGLIIKSRLGQLKRKSCASGVAGFFPKVTTFFPVLGRRAGIAEPCSARRIATSGNGFSDQVKLPRLASEN